MCKTDVSCCDRRLIGYFFSARFYTLLKIHIFDLLFKKNIKGYVR